MTATAEIQAAWNAAELERRRASRDLADARRRKQRAAQIQAELEARASRLGLQLVINRP